MSALDSKTCVQALGIFQLGRAVYCGKHVHTNSAYCAEHGPQVHGLYTPEYLSSVQKLAESAQMELRWVAR